MAVITFINSVVEIMAEMSDHNPPLIFKGHLAGQLEAVVALRTIPGYCKGCLAVMAGTAGLTFFHLCH